MVKKKDTNLVVITDGDIDLDGHNLDLPVPKSIKEIIDDNLEQVKDFYKIISSNDTSFGEKTNELVRLKTALLVPVLKGLYGQENRQEVSAAMKLSDLLTNIETSIYEKAEFELRQEIDFHHPKIQKAFSFIIEGVIDTMAESGLDELQITNFLNLFGGRFAGFEEEATKRLKGLSAQALDKVENPLMKVFKSAKKEGEKQNGDIQ